MEINTLTLKNKERLYKICFIIFEYKRNSNLIYNISHSEYKIYEKIKGVKRKEQYLWGRYIAKCCIKEFIGNENTNLSINRGIFGFPYIERNVYDLEVGIAHRKKYIAAIVFHKSIIVGIDIEDMENIETLESTLEFYTTATERRLCSGEMSKEKFYKILWICKEALGKALHIGIENKIKDFELKNIRKYLNYYLVEFTKYPEFVGYCKEWKNAMYCIIVPQSLKLIEWKEREDEDEVQKNS